MCILYVVYTQKKCQKHSIRYRGKRISLPKQVSVWNIIEVWVKNDEYYGKGYIRDTGELITLKIDQDIMSKVPGDKSTSGNPLLSLLVYDNGGEFTLTEDSIRYKTNMKYVRDNAVTQSEYDYAEYVVWFIYEIRNILLTIAAIGLYRAPTISAAMSITAFVLQHRNVIPPRFTNILKHGIMETKKDKEGTKEKHKKENRKNPPGYDAWSDNEKFLYSINKKADAVIDAAEPMPKPEPLQKSESSLGENPDCCMSEYNKVCEPPCETKVYEPACTEEGYDSQPLENMDDSQLSKASAIEVPDLSDDDFMPSHIADDSNSENINESFFPSDEELIMSEETTSESYSDLDEKDESAGPGTMEKQTITADVPDTSTSEHVHLPNSHTEKESSLKAAFGIQDTSCSANVQKSVSVCNVKPDSSSNHSKNSAPQKKNSRQQKNYTSQIYNMLDGASKNSSSYVANEMKSAHKGNKSPSNKRKDKNSSNPVISRLNEMNKGKP